MEHRRDVPGGDIRACTSGGSSRGPESASGSQGVWSVAGDGTEDAAVRGAARLPATAADQAAQAGAVGDACPAQGQPRQGESGGLKALYEELELVVRSIERIDEKLTELNRPPLPEVTLEQVREFVNSRIEDPEKLLFGAAESLKMNFLRRIIQIVVTPVEDEKERFFRITGDVDLFVARESVEQTNQVDLIGLLYTIPVAFEITRFRHQPKWALPLAA